MAIGLDLFSGSKFRRTIQDYCNQLGWKIQDIDYVDDSTLVLKFPIDSVNIQTIFISREKELLEFSIKSGFYFPSLDEIPNKLSTFLLSDNLTSKVGFWCLEKVGTRQTLTVMHNAELSLINPKSFRSIVLALVKKYEELHNLHSRR